MRVNIIMSDGSELKEVNVFKSKDLGDSIVLTKTEIEDLLDFENGKTVFFSGKYIQGGFIPKMIMEYEFITKDEDEDTLNKLKQFLYSANVVNTFGIASGHMAKWMLSHRDKIVEILKLQ